MFSKEEFIKKYDSYTDVQLIDLYANIDNYSDEAKEAFLEVIEKKGGLTHLEKVAAETLERNKEIIRIKKEVESLSKANADDQFIKTMVKSAILTKDELEAIIDETNNSIALEKEDIKIKPRTIIGGIAGILVAGIVGGILWGVMLIQTHKILYLLVAALIVLCYVTIRLFTRQSKRNTVVVLSTIISVILAVYLGQLLFELFDE